MVESNHRSVAVGVGTFVLAEAALLAFSKYKFSNTWALIEMTPGAMAMGCLAGYAFRVESENKVGEVTVADIDRIERLLREEVKEIVVNRSASIDDLDGESRFISDGDRAALMCFVARTCLEDVDRLCTEDYRLFFALHKAMLISATRGWINDRVWNGQEGALRGKLLLTLVPQQQIAEFLSFGCNPTLADCEGVTGFSRLEGEGLKEAQRKFVGVGDEERVIAWLSTTQRSDRPLSWLISAHLGEKNRVAAWIKEHGYQGDTPPPEGWSEFERQIREGDVYSVKNWCALELNLRKWNLGAFLNRMPPGAVNAHCFDSGESPLEWMTNRYMQAQDAGRQDSISELLRTLIRCPSFNKEEARRKMEELRGYSGGWERQPVDEVADGIEAALNAN